MRFLAFREVSVVAICTNVRSGSESGEFPASRENKPWMRLEGLSGGSFIRVLGKAFQSEVVSLGRQMDVLRNRGRHLVVSNLRKWHSSVSLWVASVNWTRITLNMTETKSSCSHGRRPANISIKTHPKLQISILALYPFLLLWSISGAIQKSEPCIAVMAALL